MSTRYTEEQRAQLRDGYLAAEAAATPPSAAVPDPADVEKAARAMWETHGRPPGWWDDEDAPIDRTGYRRMAVAALAAVRPSPDIRKRRPDEADVSDDGVAFGDYR